MSFVSRDILGSHITNLYAIQKEILLNLRAAWSTDRIPKQSSIGSKGNHCKQKVNEDIN